MDSVGPTRSTESRSFTDPVGWQRQKHPKKKPPHAEPVDEDVDLSVGPPDVSDGEGHIDLEA